MKRKHENEKSSAIRIAIGVVLAATMFGVFVTSASFSEQNESVGAAVVVRAEVSAGDYLPALKDLHKNPDEVASRLKGKGLRIATDDTQRCIVAVRPVRVTHEEIYNESTPTQILAASIVDGLTQQQYDSQRPGKIPLSLLTKDQQKAVVTLAKRFNLPEEYSKTLKIHVQPEWQVHLVQELDAKTVVTRFDNGFDPPNRNVISSAPLKGSVLWYGWLYSDADWGNERISIPAGTYMVADLIKILLGKLQIEAEEQASKEKLHVVADNIGVRKLVWAVAAAAGMNIRYITESSKTSVMLPYEASYNSQPGASMLETTKGYGFGLVADSEVVHKILGNLSGGMYKDNPPSGWRLPDMPLMYRNMVLDNWIVAYKRSVLRNTGTEPENAPAVQVDSAKALWSRSLLLTISVEVQGGNMVTRIPIVMM